MKWKRITFHPLDTLFFRDGRPYHEGETTQVSVKSLFPPSPATLVGAVRAAYARTMGWDDTSPQNKDWPTEIKAQLGDGKKLNGLQFHGPILSYRNEPVFPVPAHLMGKPADPKKGEGKPTELSFLLPRKKFRCDIDPSQEVYLPSLGENSAEGLKQLSGWWINKTGLEKILHQEKPDAQTLVAQQDLWSLEPRVGIKRNSENRTTEEGALYSPHHIRLHKDTSLSLYALGLPEKNNKELREIPPYSPTGGESRACFLEMENGNPTDILPPMPELKVSNGEIRYCVIILTPMLSGDMPKPGQSFLNLPGKVVSACLPRAQRLGGWDSIKREPQPLKSLLQPGSVLFMKAPAEEQSHIKNLHGISIGNQPDWGYGRIAIGTWREEKSQ